MKRLKYSLPIISLLFCTIGYLSAKPQLEISLSRMYDIEIPSLGDLTTTKPQLKFLSNRIKHLGIFAKDTIITVKTKFINNGDDTLHINNIYKSCSCTEVSIDKKSFLPNEEGELLIKIDTAGKIGEQDIVIHIIANTDEIDHIIKFELYVDRAYY